jgi:hypothetical protein
MPAEDGTRHRFMPPTDGGGSTSGRVGPGMVRRSYYLPGDVVTSFDTTVARLHHETYGIHKGLVYAAVIRAGLRHLDEVEAELREQTRRPG